jgi:hypothetical protein
MALPATQVRFYHMIHNVYARTGVAPRERLNRLRVGVGLDPDLIDQLLKAHDELQADTALAQRIAGSLSLALT